MYQRRQINQRLINLYYNLKWLTKYGGELYSYHSIEGYFRVHSY